MIRVLHFSPVRKDPEILDLHLKSLECLNDDDIELQYSFFDDNINSKSSELLLQFVQTNKNASLLNFDTAKVDNYLGDERWTPNLYHRITFIKNEVIGLFLEKDYDYLFLTDSDLILHPETVQHLVSKRKDFCSTIFWTNFKSAITYTPNAWFAKPKGFTFEDLLMLREKGVYPVDFTGACTLLSRQILSDGVSFEKISNIGYLGEDKHFCIRASVLGYQAYVSSVYPAFHIYDSSFLFEGENYIKSYYDDAYLDRWLNEEWKSKVKKMLLPESKSLLKRLLQKIK